VEVAEPRGNGTRMFGGGDAAGSTNPSIGSDILASWTVGRSVIIVGRTERILSDVDSLLGAIGIWR
jgi:hypothetical protein